jgi:hypothetical protein
MSNNSTPRAPRPITVFRGKKISLCSGIWFELKISLGSGILKPRDTCIATIKK